MIYNILIVMRDNNYLGTYLILFYFGTKAGFILYKYCKTMEFTIQ